MGCFPKSIVARDGRSNSLRMGEGRSGSCHISRRGLNTLRSGGIEGSDRQLGSRLPGQDHATSTAGTLIKTIII